ncbi:MAG: S41 family peptidase, partial [Bacteroidales bacterium]|nr:S41 family peptidase [Bacteroidales bacterium]
MSDKKDLFYKIFQIIILICAILLLAIMAVRFSSSLKTKSQLDVNAVGGNWSKLMLVLNSIDNNYMEEIDYSKITEDMIPKILKELDPHSVYFSPSELKEAEEPLQGNFDGIGIMFNVPNDTAIVTNVIVGGPSEKAGLLSGDRIITVDGRNIAGVKLPQDSMVTLIKGPRGSTVHVGIKRVGEENLIDFPIVRDVIPTNSVDVAFMLNDTTGFIKLSKFARTSYMEFIRAMADLTSKGMRRLVFDLRDNTGGYLDQALMLSNEFLNKGDLVVYMEGRKRERQDLFADGKGAFKDLPLAILINEASASSSEIFAGAMQDNDRAVIYGLRSFGKGLVQEPVYFSDGSGIRLTVAHFYTPSGRCIQKPFDDYEMDFAKRLETGELFNADSIKVVDSLKYTTKGGRVVYGGGGIIPDVFVPLDTVSTNRFIAKCNRQGAQSKFAIAFADRHRSELRNLNTLEQVNEFLNRSNVEGEFLNYAASIGLVPTPAQWNQDKEMILTQS